MSISNDVERRAPLPAVRDATADAAVNEALLQVLQRLEIVLDDEEACLRTTAVDELERVVARKDQLSLELARFARFTDRATLDPQMRSVIDRTTDKLQANAGLLKRHIDAVGEIAALISEIYSGESADGTYTSNAGRRGSRR